MIPVASIILIPKNWDRLAGFRLIEMSALETRRKRNQIKLSGHLSRGLILGLFQISSKMEQK